VPGVGSVISAKSAVLVMKMALLNSQAVSLRRQLKPQLLAVRRRFARCSGMMPSGIVSSVDIGVMKKELSAQGVEGRLS